MCMPLEVIAHPDGKRTICFDHAFPRQTINARDIYQCVFDAAFKSMNLDWKNRHDIVPSKDEQKDKQEDEKEDENLQYNTWTFGDLNILIRHQADAEMQNKEKQVMEKVLMDVKLDYFSHSLKEVVLPVERAVQWFRSYIHGHAPTLLARVHVPSHSVVSVEHKTMVDIMGKEWQPRFETNVLMHLFTHLHE
ncbi:hypothetical protein BD560DRAFT_457007 [Blakeslea trispora]|nr:hypothetical protein BD560DRAFT_457007 [Blakeslea trispora]